MRRIEQYVSIAGGGVLGAAVRWAVSETIDTSFPWPTIIVNVIGCGLLAAVMAKANRERSLGFLATGFCGGLTTFSTLTVESAQMIDDGDLAAMFIYAIASLTLGLMAFMGVRRTLETTAEAHR